MQLAQRNPQVDLETLLAQFFPPPRFGQARFESYFPDPHYPSQQQSKQRLQGWLAQPKQGWWRKKYPAPLGLYLDGGFGVGKTHLLVAAYYKAPTPRAYLSFEELTYSVGLMGMPQAVERFAQLDCLFIDEFELDDPGNAQMVTNLLGQCMERGLRVAATSNTPPGALGQGRFSAEQFRIQIMGLARRFETLSLDGEDYRHRNPQLKVQMPSTRELEQLHHRDPRPHSWDSWEEMLALLRRLHPIRYRYLLEGIQQVYITGLSPLESQNDALRFVHFIDKLYDLGVSLSASGCLPEQIFTESYRHGAFAKKFGRCLSRLTELLAAPNPYAGG